MTTKFEKEVREDLNFDLKDGSDKIMRIASLKAKWSARLIDLQHKWNELELERKKEFSAKWRHYSMDADQIIDRRDIPVYIEGDDAYQLILTRLNHTKENIDRIDGVLKSIEGLTYAISAAIKWEIFQRGG